MPIKETTFRCSRCDAEYSEASEAALCEERDDWDTKLVNGASQMYMLLHDVDEATKAYDAKGSNAALDAVSAFIEDLGRPPPPQKLP